MSRKDPSKVASFSGTDPIEQIADLEKLEELEATVELSDPSPLLPPVPLDPETGFALAAPVVADAGDDFEVRESLSAAAGPDAERADTGDDMPAPTILGKIGEGGAAVAGAARTHSIPVALLSIGIALLVRNRRHPNTALLDPSIQPGAALHATGDVLGGAVHKVADASQPIVHKAEDLAHGMAETASHVGTATIRKGSEAKDFLGRTMQESPLVLGALVLLLGMVVGLLLPGTRRENELMGETRDNLLDKAQEVVTEIKDTVQTVATTAAQEVKDTVKQATQEVAESVKHATQDVSDTVKLATMDVTDNVKEVAQDSADIVKDKVKKTTKNSGISAEA
jgi:gas vesicle protein